MSLAYLFDSNIQFQDKSGNNNVNGFLRVYIDNTDDRAVTYKDFNGTLNQADIRLDNNGRAVVIVDDSKTYRLEVYGTTGVLLWTLYPISPKATGINETLEALVAAVKSHTIAIEGLALGKKNKQLAKVISGTPTQTVKSITQNADGEISVEFEDIDFPYNINISSPDDSIEVGTPVVDPERKVETIPLSVKRPGLVKADSEDTEPGTLIDKMEVVDNVSDPEDPPVLQLQTTVDGQGNRKVALNVDNLRSFIGNVDDIFQGIFDVLDSMDFDEVPHGSFGSSLNQSPGDGTTTSIQVSIFRPLETTVGDAIAWTKTTEIGGEDFGTVTLGPGTYIICSDITCQWVGVPAGTYLPQVGNVLGEPFDFSQRQELHRRMTNVVTVSTTTQFKMRISFDAATPVMGFWINSAQIVKIAGGMSQTNVTHDSTLTGQGSVADPLGVTPAAFGKVKNIPTSISQFRTGDVMLVDGPNGPAKMSNDDLLKETAENVYPALLATFCDGVVTGKMPFVRKAIESQGTEVSSTTRVMADGVYDDVLVALPEGFVVHSVAYYSSYTDTTHFVLDSFSAVGTRLARLKKTGCVLKFTIRKDDSSEILVSDIEEFAKKYCSVDLSGVDSRFEDIENEVDSRFEDIENEVDSIAGTIVWERTVQITLGEGYRAEFNDVKLKEGTYVKCELDGDVFKNGMSIYFGVRPRVVCSGGYIFIDGALANETTIVVQSGASAVYSTGSLTIRLSIIPNIPTVCNRGDFETIDFPINFREGIYLGYRTDLGYVETNPNENWASAIVPIQEYAGLAILARFKNPSSIAATTCFVDKYQKIIGNFIANDGELIEFKIPSNAEFLVINNRIADLDNPFAYIIGNIRKNKYIHFSLDDVTDILQNLVTNESTYKSIFEEPKLALLKQLHDTYGIKVSFFVQRTMSDIPAKFKNEFVANKNWMRFGYHGQSNNLANANYEQAKTLWNTFVDGLMTSLNDYDLVDRCPRLDYFHCTLDGAKGLRDAKCGIVGLLSCDDWAYNKEVRQTNYYLTDERSTWLDKQDKWVDNENQLTIIKTDFRMEQIISRWGSTASCIADYSSADRAGEAFYLEIFSHENVFAQFTAEMRTIFDWALKSGYKFEFPMDVIIGVV